MKRMLNEWVDEIGRQVEAIARTEQSMKPADGEAGAELIHHGYPGALPLWRDGTVIVALLGLPGVAPGQWPAVRVKGREAGTLAADAATLLPRFLMQRRLSNLPAAADELAMRWPDLSGPMRNLHLSLGGAPPSLDALVRVLADKSSRDAFRYTADNATPFESAHSALARDIDRSPAFRSYADWFDSCISGKLPPVETRLYAVWARQALGWAFNLSKTGEPEIDDPRAPVALVEAFTGLDTGFPIKASWSASPAEGSTADNIPIVARSVLLRTVADDPVQSGLLRAIRSAGSDYKGHPHAEAVVALDERGEPERAWGALHSAAWWMARNIGEAPPAILDGARLLCDRHGWDDLRWVVDRNAGGAA